MSSMMVVCLGFCAPFVAAEEFHLKYRLTASIEEEVGAAGQSLSLLAEPAKLRDQSRFNADKPIYSSVLIGANQEEHAVVLDRSNKDGSVYDALYVDTNGDGLLTPTEKYPGTEKDTAWTFGPVKFVVNDGSSHSPQWFWFRFVDYELDKNRQVRTLHAINAGYYLGRVTFGDIRRLVAVVDSNGNGIYNDFARPGGKPGDKLLIDADGDGEFDVRLTGEETQPLGRYLLVRDRYWQFEVAADGSKVSVSPLAKDVGTLRSPISEFALLLRSDDGDLRVRGAGGIARLPAGTYRLIRFQYALNDPAGRRWVFSGGGENRVNITVPPNETSALPIGLPLVPKVEVTRIDNERLALTLRMHGAANETYNEIFYNAGIKPPVPKVRLFDSAGKELTLLDFHYG
jgi:hypothetical protein